MPEGTEEKNDMQSAVKAHNLKADMGPLSGPDLRQDLAQNQTPEISKIQGQGANPVKIRFAFKAVEFCFSVVTLSWFFEGMRQCKDAASPQGLSYLVGGTVLTLFLVGLQAFFIYCEERSKG